MNQDIAILRELARRKMEIVVDPLNQQRKQDWLDLHSGRQTRPLILAEDMGIRDPRKPFEPPQQCVDDWAREAERSLRYQIWRFEHLRDDWVLEPWHDIGWAVSITPDFGVQPVVHELKAETMTSRSWTAPVTDIRRDFHRLKHREFSVDRPATLARKRRLEEAFGDLLPVRIRGTFWWTFGLTIQAIEVIGLENLMLFMYDDPEGLQQLLAFLRDDNLALARWAEREGLLSLNNENDYIGSGSIGYTRSLPAPDWQPGQAARMKDQWLLLESQETVGVGPELFEEFIFPYHREIAACFGRIYYGCCEPLHTRWDVVRRLPNLAACSVAPLADQERLAAALRGDYIFSRKPNPTLISTGSFNEEEIRADLRHTLTVARQHGCRLELIMKDVHTLNNDPTRLARWIILAREEIARHW